MFLNVFLANQMCCWWSTSLGWFENNYQVVQNHSECGLDVLDWLEVKFEKENNNIYIYAILWMCFLMYFWPSGCVVGGPLHLDDLKTIFRRFKIILKVVLMFWTDRCDAEENSNIVWCIVNVFLNVFLAIWMCCWWSTPFGWFENNFQMVQNNSEGGLDALD